MRNYYLVAAMLSVFFGFNYGALGQGVELTDDVSRQELFNFGRESFRSIPERFTLPQDSNDKSQWTFGIDVSHYDGKVDWTLVGAQGVSFVYVKATQGENSFDGRFAENWTALGSQKQNESALYRGTYHFLSADGDPAAQAKNFISVVGAFAGGDLPPCLDLEWDITRGTSKDRFSKYSAPQIVQKVKAWLVVVERATSGRKPIIYTNKSFWTQHGLDRVGGLEGYEIWVADYSKKSLLNEDPKSPPGLAAPLWQFSESGHFAKDGVINANLDISVFKGSRADFGKKFGLP